jgi:hypothetical protein
MQTLITSLLNLTPRLASSNHLYNSLQHYKKVLVLDFRNAKPFKTSHFFFSVNLPSEEITPGELMNYDGNSFMEQHIVSAKDKELFKQRKCLMVYILLSNEPVTPLFGDRCKFDFNALNDQRVLVPLLAYYALNREKVRELYILKDGFKEVLRIFPFLCLFSGVRIYIEPYLFY